MISKGVTTRAYLFGATVASLLSVAAIFAFSVRQSPLPQDQQIRNMVVNLVVFFVILWLSGALFSIPFLMIAHAVESRYGDRAFSIYGAAGGASGMIGAATLMLVVSSVTGDFGPPGPWIFNCSILCFSGVVGGLAFSWSRRWQLRKLGPQDVAAAFD
jgi:MFS family permease